MNIFVCKEMQCCISSDSRKGYDVLKQPVKEWYILISHN